MKKALAGTAAVDITPPIGVRMQGYASRDHGAEGIHDRLFSTALVLDDGEVRVALVTCDLVGLGIESVRALRETAADLSRIDPKSIMVCCSHTHGGPATGQRCYVDEESEYLNLVRRQIASSIALAAGRLRECKLWVGIGSSDIGINRREPRDGGIVLGENPEGEVDHELVVLRIDTIGGRPEALIYNYPCHTATLKGDNYLITADYVNYSRRTVEGGLGIPQGSSLFVNGAAGDINPSPRGTFDLARMLGTALAADTLRAYAKAQPIDTALSYLNRAIELPLSRPPSPTELRSELAELQVKYESQKTRNPSLAARITWHREMLRRTEDDSLKDSLAAEIQALRIGPLAILSLPGEVFAGIGKRIKEDSPFSYNMVAGYANGNVGYIPTPGAFEEGGYEPNSHFYRSEQAFRPDVGDVLVSESGALLRELKGD